MDYNFIVNHIEADEELIKYYEELNKKLPIVIIEKQLYNYMIIQKVSEYILLRAEIDYSIETKTVVEKRKGQYNPMHKKYVDLFNTHLKTNTRESFTNLFDFIYKFINDNITKYTPIQLELIKLSNEFNIYDNIYINPRNTKNLMELLTLVAK